MAEDGKCWTNQGQTGGEDGLGKQVVELDEDIRHI